MRKCIVAVVTAILGLSLVASAAWANVIPNDSRPGDPVLTRMECFTGTVQFTITGNGVSIPMGSAVAGSDGWAQLNFAMPSLAPGQYTMVGIGPDCDNPAVLQQTNVGFRVLPPRGSEYPPVGNFAALDAGTVSPGGRLNASAGYFVGPAEFTLVELGRVLGTSVARVDGIAALSFDAPTAAGDYTLRVTGTDRNGQPVAATSSFRVLSASVAATPGPIVPAAPIIPATPIIGVDAVVSVPRTPENVVPVQVAGITETRADVLGSVASTSNTRGQLVRTGSDAGALVRYALVAIAIGGALIVGTRRRTPSRVR